MFCSRASTLICWVLICALFAPWSVMAQESEEVPEPPGYKPPTKAEWLEAGLELEELSTAMRYEVSLEDWKEMDISRHNQLTAGWACVGVALLTPAIEATVIWGGGVPYTTHPEAEVFIVVNVAALATLVTGIVLLATAPGPDDFKERWMRENEQFSLRLMPTPGGLGLGFSF